MNDRLPKCCPQKACYSSIDNGKQVNFGVNGFWGFIFLYTLIPYTCTDWHNSRPNSVLKQRVRSKESMDKLGHEGPGGSVTQASKEEKHCRLEASKVQSWGTGCCLLIKTANRVWKQYQVELRRKLAGANKEEEWKLQAGGGCCFYDIFLKWFCFLF